MSECKDTSGVSLQYFPCGALHGRLLLYWFITPETLDSVLDDLCPLSSISGSSVGSFVNAQRTKPRSCAQHEFGVQFNFNYARVTLARRRGTTKNRNSDNRGMAMTKT